MTYGYDAANQLTSVTDWNSNATTYAYDDAGRMTTATLPSGTGIVSSYTYDDADRLTGIDHVKGGSTTLAFVDHTLDDVGNRTQRIDGQGTHTYAYDDLYRLTSVTYPGPLTTTYDFDAFGNRTEMTNGSGTTNYTYDDADRLMEVEKPGPVSVLYDWDDNGNLIERGTDTFAWDYEDRMVSATVNSIASTFAYRGDGLRHSRTTGMTTTTFTWDIASGLPTVIDDGNQYVYGAAGLNAMKQGGNWYYYLADGLGSTMAVVNASGVVQNSYTYDVYGEASVTGALANEFDFAGQQTDSTGLQYLRARYMDPETGTFLSRDPMSILPHWIGSSIGYGSASPSNYIDPDGLCPRFTPKHVCKAAGKVKDGAGAVADKAGDAAGAVKDGAVSIGSAVAKPFQGDPLQNLLTIIQVLDALPLGAACVGVAIANALAGAACYTLDVGIGLAAFFASAIQASQNSCSPGQNAAYFILGGVSVAADLFGPAKNATDVAKIIKELVESGVDLATLTGQASVTVTCSSTPTVTGSQPLLGEKV